MIGQHISHFYILRQLGGGGMGVVYEAQDTRLPRSVAVKFLKPTLAAHADSMRRFRREAQLASSLNHPNICTILDVDEAAGHFFIAMELLRGRSLTSRLTAEPLPLGEIIDIATQVADGLAAAHEQGIVHRDIAPGNVFLTESGLVKILDFGLAKHFSATDVGGPTTDELTAPGVAAGTLAYMAPEQLDGDAAVDYRCDLYSLGILLYQMATGARPFEATPNSALASAIRSESYVPMRSLAPDRPPELERIVDKLLARRPEDRYQSARAVRADLDALRSGSVETRPPVRRTPKRRWGFAVGTLAGIAIVVWMVARGLTVPAAAANIVSGLIDESRGSTITMTPDGQTQVYTGSIEAGRPIMLRALRRLATRALAGTEGANKPIVAPDGRRLAFFTNDEKLKIISIDDGSTTVVGAAWQFGEAAWDGDSAIITDGFRRAERGLTRHVLNGSGPVVLTRPDTARGERTHTSPFVIPNTRVVVFTIVVPVGAGPGPKNGQLAMVSLDQRRQGDAALRHIPLGIPARRAIAFVDDWLLYTSEDGGAIMAVRLDVKRQRAYGSRVAVWEDSSANMDAASLANNGSLLYVRRPKANSLVMVDEQGAKQLLVAGSQGGFMYPRFSPDRKRFTVQLTSNRGETDVSVYDVASRTRTRLTSDGKSMHPTWTPRGDSIVFWTGDVGEGVEFWSQPSDGAGPAMRIALASGGFAPMVTPNGQTLVFHRNFDNEPTSIWQAPMRGGGAPRRVFNDVSPNYMPEVSTDGRWLAYVSSQDGREEVFVRAFPGPGSPMQVSTNGGTEPGWSPDGSRIFYREKRALMSVRITTTPSFSKSLPERLFEGAFDAMLHRNYDVSLDGKQFLMIATTLPDAVMVTNWLPELRYCLRAAAKGERCRVPVPPG